MRVAFEGTPADVIAEMRAVLSQHTPANAVNGDEIALACRALVRAGEKIHAIRLYRARYPTVTLLEAKRAVEKFPALPKF